MYSFLLEYSMNFNVTLPLPLVWKLPFDICQDFGTCLFKQGKHLVVPSLWNMRSPSDPVSNRTLKKMFLRLLEKVFEFCGGLISGH